MLTNWIGYLLLAGIVFLLRPLDMPPDWTLGSRGPAGPGRRAARRWCVAYLLACTFSRKRIWTHPGARDRVAAAADGADAARRSRRVNWLLIAGVVCFCCCSGRVAYHTVLAALLVAAIAGVLTHVPAGLGVLEAVFVTLLSSKMPTSGLLAALLAYRGYYYLVPLAIAAAAYLFLEARIYSTPA